MFWVLVGLEFGNCGSEVLFEVGWQLVDLLGELDLALGKVEASIEDSLL